MLKDIYLGMMGNRYLAEASLLDGIILVATISKTVNAEDGNKAMQIVEDELKSAYGNVTNLNILVTAKELLSSD